MTEQKKFKFSIPIHVFFYSAVYRIVTLKECGQQITGPYQLKSVYGDIGTAVIEETSFSVPGNYFFKLLENNDPVFSQRLFEIGKNLTKFGEELELIYYQNVKNNTVSELKEFYPRYLETFTPAGGLGYSLDYVFDQYVKENKIDLGSLKPRGQSFQNREKIDLKKVFSITDEKERQQAINDHALRYAWLLNSYTGEHPVSPDYFLNRRDEIQKVETETYEEINSPPNNILDWISWLTFVRDERKRVNVIANGLLDRYLKKECRERNIEYQKAAMCTLDEFEQLKTRPDLIPERPVRYLKFTETGPVDITANEWEEFVAAEQSTESYVSGQVASKGYAKGPAKIIFGPADFHKINQGDVIIASMTRPEYAPILGKCSAIVTNEGGVTCHAAIVSREMKIPCIIGTQTATDIFKDGDLVEVDAENGIIKKLN